MMSAYSYDCAVYSEWCSGVDKVARASLEQSLLLRDPVVMHLTVNFDPKVKIHVIIIIAHDLGRGTHNVGIIQKGSVHCISVYVHIHIC